MKNRIIYLTPILLLCAFLFSSCATMGPQISQEELKRKQDEFNAKFFEASKNWLPRVYRVGYRLISNPVPGHGNEQPKVGFVGVGVDEIRDFSRKACQIDESVKGVLVLGHYPGSKAESADIQWGDVIESVNGKNTQSLPSYFDTIKNVKGDSVQAKIWRKGQVIEKNLPVEKVYYNAHFFLAPTPNLDAQSLFSRIDVGIGAIRYCRNDDELAMIMGHELAHTTLKHSMKKLGSSIASALVYGVVAGVIDAYTVRGLGNIVTSPVQQASDNAVSREYENQADYVGTKHAFHSGYDVQNGMKVFSRLATDAPGFNIFSFVGSSHPDPPERFLRLEKTLEELKTQFPAKFEKQTAELDWDIVIPVQLGETVETAMERMIQEKKLRIELDEKRANEKELDQMNAVFWQAFVRKPSDSSSEANAKNAIWMTWEMLELNEQKSDEFQTLHIPETAPQGPASLMSIEEPRKEEPLLIPTQGVRS